MIKKTLNHYSNHLIYLEIQNLFAILFRNTTTNTIGLKLEQLTFTRFLAAIMIVFHHYARGFFPFNTAPAHFIIENANIGVSFFYLLSGFVLVIAYGKKETITPEQFYTNRFARIYPLYLISLLLIVISYTAANQMDNFKGLLLNLLVVQAWFPPEATRFNAQAWSIGVEFFFYLIFPFLIKHVYKKYNFRKTTILFLSFWLVTQILFNAFLRAGYDKGLNTDSHNLLFYFPPMHLSTFLLGNLAGFYFLNKKKAITNYHDLILVLCFIVLIVVMSGPQYINFHNGLMAAVFIPLILVLSEGKGKIAAIFAKRPMVFLGEISYGIYILQYPVFIFCYSIFKKLHIVDPYRFYISLCVLVLVASAGFKLIEMPARKWLQGLCRPRVSKNK